MKPIETNEAVKKGENKIKPTAAQLSLLQRQMRGEIAIPGQNGVSFIELNEIVFVEVSNNYSILVLWDKRIFTVSKTLKDVQDFLEESHFLKVHRRTLLT